MTDRRPSQTLRAARCATLAIALVASPADASPAHRPADAERPASRSALAASAADRVHAEVQRRTRSLDPNVRVRVAREILTEAARAGLDPLLVVALISVESSFDHRAISPVGAAGLMQVRPSTMHEVAARSRLPSADPLDPVANVKAGIRYLGELVAAFGDAELALMAYNAGPGRIRRYLNEGGVPERFRVYPRSVARELDRLGPPPALAEADQSPLTANDVAAPRG